MPIDIKQTDLQIDTYKASGAGGQYVNKTESAIRITHVPTGLIVASQQERLQMQNREKAMTMLRAMLYERQQREKEEAMDRCGVAKSAPAIAPRKFAPTTFRKTA